MRKHATGTAKIELHVLHVERGNGSINKNKNYSFFFNGNSAKYYLFYNCQRSSFSFTYVSKNQSKW